jgi:hypothetical protein
MPDFDFSELDDLADDFGRISENLVPFASAAVKTTAADVKASWAGKLKGSRTLPQASRSIRYAMLTKSETKISAEVRPRLGGQGSLVWVREFGSLSTAPRLDGQNSAQENSDAFLDRITRAVADAERAAGF